MLFIGCNSKTTTPAGNLPVLTQAQMYQDFDSLVYIIENVNPQLIIKKKITGIDYLSELKLMRNEIKDCKNTEEFILLINKAFTLMQDGHCNILFAHPYFMPYKTAQYLYELTDSMAYCNTLKYINFFDKTEETQKFWLEIKYINGEYYLLEPFKYKNRIYKEGFKITEFNGESIHSFVQKLAKYRIRMRWDFNNNRYYSEMFFWALPYLNIKYFSLTFCDKNEKKITDLFDNFKKVYNYERQIISSDKDKKIKYFSNSCVLYIKLKKMDLNYLNLDDINELSKNKKINKIVIDIRGNSGGNDNTWLKLLGRIIDKPIIYPVKQLVKNSNIIRYKLKNEIKDFKNTEKISLLDNEEFLVIYNQNDTIYPDKKSIKYKGKIYLLQDEEIYSSALALSSVAALSDKIVSVGQTTGWMGGMCITPIAFTLPNSKLIFTIEPAIDATNIKTINNFWKDTVEVPFNPPLDYYINRAKSKEKLNIEDDQYYKKVIELK